MRRRVQQVLLTAATAALTLWTASGCASGCDDGASDDVIEVTLPTTPSDEDVVVSLRLCQEGRCSETVPTVAAGTDAEVAVSDFGQVDVDGPGELTVSVLGAEGEAIAERTVPLEFQDTATGAGCGPRRTMRVDLSSGAS